MAERFLGGKKWARKEKDYIMWRGVPREQPLARRVPIEYSEGFGVDEPLQRQALMYLSSNLVIVR